MAEQIEYDSLQYDLLENNRDRILSHTHGVAVFRLFSHCLSLEGDQFVAPRRALPGDTFEALDEEYGIGLRWDNGFRFHVSPKLLEVLGYNPVTVARWNTNREDFDNDFFEDLLKSLPLKKGVAETFSQFYRYSYAGNNAPSGWLLVSSDAPAGNIDLWHTKNWVREGYKLQKIREVKKVFGIDVKVPRNLGNFDKWLFRPTPALDDLAGIPVAENMMFYKCENYHPYDEGDDSDEEDFSDYVDLN